MAAGSASWSDISGTINFIHDSAMAVARMANLLAPTVTQKSAIGMFDRKVWEWNALSFSEHTEESDEASQVFDKDMLASLTPKNYHGRADLTDERVASDPDGILAAAALEFGSASARHVDESIAALFGTTGWGGTIGSGVSSTISWRSITKAYALLVNKGIPVGAPVFCALHPYQWEVLLAASSIAAASVAVAPGFQDAMMASNFFRHPAAYGVTFAVTNAPQISGTAAYGLLYSPLAIALDTRKPFGIEPQRDASKQAWELNASMWYVAGQWRPDFGVCLYHNAATPS
jgi:hypothetical protein